MLISGADCKGWGTGACVTAAAGRAWGMGNRSGSAAFSRSWAWVWGHRQQWQTWGMGGHWVSGIWQRLGMGHGHG